MEKLALRSLAFIFVLALTATIFTLSITLSEARSSPDPQEIRQYTISGRLYFIPRAYTDFPYASIGESIHLQAWYPGSSPVPGEPNDLWRKGEWEKNVRILINFPPKPNPVKVMEEKFELYHIDKNLGDLYGLQHYTQSDPKLSFQNDLYVEDKMAGSVISCSKKRDKDDKIQLCDHYFLYRHGSFQITYNKNILSEWKMIKKNVLEMYESFHHRETAQAYIAQFYPVTKPGKEGK